MAGLEIIVRSDVGLWWFVDKRGGERSFSSESDIALQLAAMGLEPTGRRRKLSLGCFSGWRESVRGCRAARKRGNG